MRVSDAALELAREFAADVRLARPGHDFVIAFDWADWRMIRKVDGPRQELGPGLDLAIYEPRDIPAGVTQSVAGLRFAVRIPSHIYENSVHRLIDFDERTTSKLTLR